MKTVSIYETVTNKIVAELEQGAIPWTRPWKTDKRSIGIMPTNAATGRTYSGVNIPILWHAAGAGNFPTHAWMTFKQAQEKGANVRKGEKGTQVVFTKRLTVKDEDDEETA